MNSKSSLLRILVSLSLISLSGCEFNTSPASPKTLEIGVAEFHAGRHEEAKKILHKFAEIENPTAQFYMALLSFDDNDAHGNRVKQDAFSLSLDFLRRSAASGYEPAIRRLGTHYENGWGVELDQFMAEDRYREANNKNAPPSAKPDYILSNGEALKVVDNEALIEATRVKAESGDLDAIYSMSQFFENQIFANSNPEQAFLWHQKAADQGSRRGQFLITYFTCKGIGTKQSVQEANRLKEQYGIVGNCHESKEVK